MPLRLSGSTGISGIDGTAAVPAFQGSTANTGIYYAANTIYAATRGNTAVTIDANGNVGIGNTSPLYKLEVTDNTTGQQLRLSSSHGNGTSMAFDSSSANGRVWRIGSNYVDGYGEFAVYDATANAKRLNIDSSGRVTMPAQPIFNAYRTTSWTTIPGVIICDNTSINIGGHYSTSTGRFTAPVAGTYMFILYTMGYTTINTYNDNFLRKNGVQMTAGFLRTWTGSGTGAITSGSYYATLAANDYVDFFVNVGPNLYSDSNIFLKFGGHLIG